MSDSETTSQHSSQDSATDDELAAALDEWNHDDDFEQEQYQPTHAVREQTGSDAGQNAGAEAQAMSTPALHTPLADSATATAPPASAPTSGNPRSRLSSLPHELQLRIWYFLSCMDLCTVARVDRMLRALSSQQVLWRRLYCARWGKPQEHHGDTTWKALYQSKDAEDSVRFGTGWADQGADDVMATMYRDMQRARRQQCLGRGQVEDSMEVPRAALQQQLEDWRRVYPPVLPGQPARLSPSVRPEATGAGSSRAPAPSSSGLDTTNAQHASQHYCPASPSQASSAGASTCVFPSPNQPAAAANQTMPDRAANQSVQPLTWNCPEQPSTTAAHPAQPCATAVHAANTHSGVQHTGQEHSHSPQPAQQGQQREGVEPTQAGAGTHPLSAKHNQGGGSLPTSAAAGPSTSVARRPGVAQRLPAPAAQKRPSAARRAAASNTACGGPSRAAPVRHADDNQAAVRPALELHGRSAYTWDKIGDHFCCRETGWVHLCDHTCREGVIDPSSDLLVCPISCRTVDRMLTDWELRAAQSAREGHDEQDPDFGGFVGRAYELGYNCRTFKELQRRCGVRL